MNTFNDSRESILIRKKEAELREAKRRENEHRRKFETKMKCVIGGTFHKHFSDAYLFDKNEWDRIIGELVRTDTFRDIVKTIYTENMTGGIASMANQDNNPAQTKASVKGKPAKTSIASQRSNDYTEEYYGVPEPDEGDDTASVYSPYNG